METLVQARRGRLVLAERWRKEAKVEAIRAEEVGPGEERLRGGVVVAVRGLRVEAEEMSVRWLPETVDLLLYAEDVALFRQRRGQPYESRDLSALTMANDQVSLIQQ